MPTLQFSLGKQAGASMYRGRRMSRDLKGPEDLSAVTHVHLVVYPSFVVQQARGAAVRNAYAHILESINLSAKAHWRATSSVPSFRLSTTLRTA